MVGYSPCGHKELDTDEQLHFTSKLLSLKMKEPNLISERQEGISSHWGKMDLITNKRLVIWEKITLGLLLYCSIANLTWEQIQNGSRIQALKKRAIRKRGSWGPSRLSQAAISTPRQGNWRQRVPMRTLTCAVSLGPPGSPTVQLWGSGGLTDTVLWRLQPTVPAKHFPDTPAPEADHEDQGQNCQR